MNRVLLAQVYGRFQFSAERIQSFATMPLVALFLPMVPRSLLQPTEASWVNAKSGSWGLMASKRGKSTMPRTVPGRIAGVGLQMENITYTFPGMNPEIPAGAGTCKGGLRSQSLALQNCEKAVTFS